MALLCAPPQNKANKVCDAGVFVIIDTVAFNLTRCVCMRMCGKGGATSAVSRIIVSMVCVDVIVGQELVWLQVVSP